jgi:probable HAF family extracellular repeat protein
LWAELAGQEFLINPIGNYQVKSSSKRKSKARHFVTACIVAVSVVSFIANSRSEAMVSSYTITDLGTLGGSPNQSHGYGINNCGTTVGDSIPATGPAFLHPFYKKGGTMTDVGTLGSGDGTAYSLNSFGYVVGYSTSSVGQRAFLWHDNDDDGVSDPGEFVDFLPAGAIGVAYDINDSNVVVGLVDTSGGSSLSDTPFKWDATNGLQILSGGSGVTPTRAQGINNAGTIAGWASVSVPPFAPVHGFVLKNNTYIDLGTLDTTVPSLMSFAWRISEDGHVVGYGETPSNNASKPIHPFVWFDANNNNMNDAGEMKDLGTLSGTNAYGYDINASGYVVGTSDVTGGGTHAYVWHDDNSNGVNDPGEMKDLNAQFSDASWTTLVEARSINDGGQIVGWGTMTNGETHAFLLTPTVGFNPTACPTPNSSPSPTPTPATTSLTNVSGTGTYGGTATLTATLMSGGTPVSGKAISFTVNAGSVCDGVSQPACPTTDGSGVATLSGVSLSGINAGTYSTAVGASFAGDASYASSNGTGALTVNPGSQTITFSSLANRTFGDAPFTVSGTGGASGNPVTFGATGNCISSGTNGSTITITGAGSCTVTASQAGNANYSAAADVPQSFTISKANQTITFGSLSNKTFGDAPFTVSATGGGSTSPVTFTATGNCSHTGTNGSTITLTGAGSCTVTASQAGDANYFAAANVPQSFNIAKATATITLSNLTHTYDGNPKFATAATSPAGLNVVITYSQGGFPISAPTNVGSYDVLATINEANYQGTKTDTLVINSKITPVINWNNPTNITYGTALSSIQLNATASVPGTFTYSPEAGTVLHVGNAQTLHVDFIPTDGTNYNNTSRNVSINVLKAGLTITADNKVKLLGDPNPPLTFTPSGFVNGDTSTVLTGTPTITTTATQGSPVGNYPITITQGTLAAADYSFTFVNGTLSVTEASPVILLETGTSNAAAVDSVTFVRGPFHVSDNYNFSGDHLTRIIIFTMPLADPDQTLAVRASGIDLPIENVGTVTGVAGLSASYIVVKLPQGLPTGDLALTVTLRGITSNSATLSIIP